MGKYSRSRQGFDRSAVSKFCCALLVGGLIAACASTPPASPQVMETPPPPPMIQAPQPEPVVSRQPVQLRPEAPLTYVVKKGDTLWDISNHFLLDPWQWPEVWYVNDQVRNPHLIYPGDVLRLSTVNGRPQLGLDVEHVSPQIRELPLEGAIPTIPLDAIRDFLHGPRLVTPEELQAAPYLLSFLDDHLIGGEGTSIYVQNLLETDINQYAVVRKGDIYRDPDDNSVIGYEALPIGVADVREFAQPAIARLSRTYREALIGDRLLPIEPDAFQANFYPHAPDHPIGGRIIAAFDGVGQISQFQIVAINRGSNHGLEPGHVLQILNGGGFVDDPYGKKRVQLPDQPAGQLLIFKTTPRLSYGLIMSVTRPAHALDRVEKPRPTR